MVENVEEFKPKFKRSSLGELGCLVERDVPIVYAWSIKECVVGGSQGAQGLKGKLTGRKVLVVCRGARIVECNRLGIVIRLTRAAIT